MDSNQVPPEVKRSRKKGKPKSPGKQPPKCNEIGSQSPLSPQLLSTITSPGELKELKQGSQLHPPLNALEPGSSSPLNTQACTEEPEGKSLKRKRNRKKKNKKQIGEESQDCEQSETGRDFPPASVANISASFLPVVEEAIQLLKASEQPMNSGASASNCVSSSQPPLKHNFKESVNLSENIEKIVSPGAQLLTLDQETPHSTSGLRATETSTRSSANAANLCEFNSQDAQLLNCAQSIGPIYSRSSFCSPVTVTCSSASSQLSSDRTRDLHLFGYTHQPSTPKTSSHPVVSSTDKMSAPSTVEKSREEVEAERKARKAAKAAAKRKPKEILQESAKLDKSTDIEAGKAKEVPKGESNTISAKEKGQKTCEERLTEGVKSLSITETEKKTSKSKSVDVPDCAIAVRFPKVEDCIPANLKEAMIQQGMEKSKAELRAERRAKQEAQRAAKAQQQAEKQVVQQQAQQQKSEPSIKPEKVAASVSKDQEKRLTSIKSPKEVKEVKADRRVKLFSHLYQNSFKNISQTIGVSHPQYHSSIVRLGVQYANRVVLGSNARCLALLYTLKDVIASYETPPQKEFSRGLEAYLQPNMDLLQTCRPHSVSMINALRYIKWQLTQLSIGDSDAEAKQKILDAIDQYIDDQIGKAAEAIGKVVKDKIDDNDVILVYACSSLVLSALKVAMEEQRKFHVIVVDSLPWLEGREMLRRLVAMGVQCSYVHLSAASFVMRQASKVLLGAHALLANGYVMSRAGSSQIALMAHAYNVPVLVCCETHKFSERVQTDSFVYNELADPDELIGSKRAGEREVERERPLSNWRNIPSLSLLNLVYDVTPPDLVTAVVTERAILPCTSVPVILRMKPTEC